MNGVYSRAEVADTIVACRAAKATRSRSVTIAPAPTSSTSYAARQMGFELIALFVTFTTPVTLMLLARAAIYRDRSEAAADVPTDIGDGADTRPGAKRVP